MTTNSTRKPRTVKLTDLRFDILQLCATRDERGYAGIPGWLARNFKPSSKRTVTFLMKNNLVYYDAFGYLSATPDGFSLYEAWLNEEDGPVVAEKPSTSASNGGAFWPWVRCTYSNSITAQTRAMLAEDQAVTK